MATQPVLILTMIGMLPMYLRRPDFSETKPPLKRFSLESNVNPDWVRKKIADYNASSLACMDFIEEVADTRTDIVPKTMTFTMPEKMKNGLPTHLLAAVNHGDTKGDAPATILYPIHEMPLRFNCNKLPRLPKSELDFTAATHTIPIVPFDIPSPKTFYILRKFFYTQDACFLEDEIEELVGHNDLQALSNRAGIIHDVWRNACAVQILDKKVWDAVDDCWEELIDDLKRLSDSVTASSVSC